MFPTLILGPLGGAVVDRYKRQRLLVVNEVLSLLQSAALAVLTFLGWITIPQVLWLSVLQGALNAFDMPGRQAFLIEIIEDRADLPNAIAMNSSLFNGARLIGPAIAGSLIAVVGEAWCFGIDALSYVAVVLALLAMHVPRKPANVSGLPKHAFANASRTQLQLRIQANPQSAAAGGGDQFLHDAISNTHAHHRRPA